MLVTQIEQQVASLLQNLKPIQYNGIILYLISQETLREFLDLELQVRQDELDKGIKKHNHFYDYAKIINAEHPAFKYTLSMKHKKKEIFSPDKVSKALPSEFEIWKSKSRLALKKQIEDQDNSITDSQAIQLKATLEKEIASSQDQR
ncbi:MAG: hypothetical protein Q9M36_12410 [Sulfurovum sp.]|nr:hypothetical protein [Sulfurovum sp.]